MTVTVRFERTVEKWLSVCGRRGFSEETIRSYRFSLQKFFTWLAQTHSDLDNLAEVSREELADYQKYLFETKYKTSGGKERRRSVATQQSRILAVLSFFKHLVRTEVILTDPGAAIEIPKTTKRIPRNYLSVREMRKLLSCCDLKTHIGLRNSAALEILYSSGIRAGELRRLRLSDANLYEGMLTIRKGKGGKDRVVPIGKAAVYFLSAYLQKSRPHLVKEKQHPFVFVNQFGKPLSYSGLLLLVRIATKRAGIKRRITPHSMRHTCATLMLRGKADIRHIQELLGHAQLSSTQIYTRVEISDLKKVHARCHPREAEPIEKK